VSEGPVLIHVWRIDPAREAAGLEQLDELFRSEVATDPGFKSARILESDDRSSLAAVIEMRSVEDRRRIEQIPEMRETLEHLHSSADLLFRLYHQAKVYGA
jgi:hypothetical protein